MPSVVAVVKTSPDTVVADYRRVMHLADYQTTLSKSGGSQASLTTYNATTGGKNGRRPSRFLSDNPSRPCATKRRAH